MIKIIDFKGIVEKLLSKNGNTINSNRKNLWDNLSDMQSCHIILFTMFRFQPKSIHGKK